MKKYVLKCRTYSGAVLYFCHQYVAGTKQNIFVSNITSSLFYYEYEMNLAEIELLKIMEKNQIKTYAIEILQVLPGAKKPR